MKLTAANVTRVTRACLSEAGDEADAVVVKGVIHTFTFDAARVKEKAPAIAEMLRQLPDPFHEDSGGGWSFLNACYNAQGEHWGEHDVMEQLFCLGAAIGRVKCSFPRKLWTALPGNMPYYLVTAAPAGTSHA